MAIVNYYTVDTFEFPDDAEITVMEADHLQVTAWPLAVHFFGAFQYGDDFTGTLTGVLVENIAAGAPYYEASGLAHDANLALWLFASGGLETAEEYLLSGADTVVGHEGDDYLAGYAGPDSISGGAGSDMLDDGWQDDAPDTLAGGSGDDLYFVTDVDDTVIERTGEGYDIVFADSTYAIPAGVEDLAVVGDAPADLTGNSAANVLTGNTWVNRMRGLEGDDTLNGIGGADTLEGGSGSDLYVVDADGVTLVEAQGAGDDRVEASISLMLPPGFETLVLTGSAGIDAGGNEGPNRLEGNDAANRLWGGAGADTMHGVAGDDTYWIDSALDIVWDASGDDAIVTAIENYTLGAGDVENLVLADGVARGAGDANANRLHGNGGANTLSGGAGNDTLDGYAGADSLDGRAGDDTYRIDNAGDAVVEASAEGMDTIASTVSMTLPANVESLVLEGWDAIGGTGNALDNRIVGNASHNLLDGGPGGRDTLEGGAGSDTYVIGDEVDVIVESADDASPDFVRASVSFDMLARAPLAEQLVLAGSADLNGRGNTLANFLMGNAGRNVLTALGPASMFGYEGNDTLIGGAGDDRLLGGPGADSMAGGAGNDWYEIEGEGDIAVELAAQGIDTIVVPWGMDMPANFERLMLGGSGDFDATGTSRGGELLVGNDGANVLHTGGGAGDRLEGAGGDDTLHDDGAAAVLTGGFGDDRYVIANSGTLIYDADQRGSVTASVDFTLWPSVLHLTLDGAHRGTGNEGANRLTGDAVANVLDGMQGDDTLDGGAGNDTLIGDAGYDTARYVGASGGYTLMRSGGSVLVSGPEGTDRLTGIEQLAFGDRTVVLDASAPTGEVVLTGAFAEGHVVTARALGLGDADGIAGPVAWQWFRVVDEAPESLGFGIRMPLAPIAGADLPELAIPAGDAWTALYMARAQFVDGAGNTETVWSGLSPNVQEAGDTSLQGTPYADAIVGTVSDEYIWAAAGNDTLGGGGGDDYADGGPGIDTAVLDSLGPLHSYGREGDVWWVNGTEGQLRIAGMERVQFGEQLFALDTDPGETAWNALALQWAWLGHAPDAASLGAAILQLDGGADLVAVAAGLLGEEFAPLSATPALVQHLFATVAGIHPDASQVAAYASQVGAGLTWESNAELLAAVALFDVNTVRFAGVAGTPVSLDAAVFG